ncbi:MAG TPA: MCE family protein [Gammaproteobacteria bacterium]|nr:MCE family protein [Gammaproteobacteria bacterium]
MSKKANPTLIGLFVVAAVGLFVLATFLLSDGSLFSKKKHYVLFFENTVTGLTVGSPVSFRGVKVGTVTDITLQVDPETEQIYIPVHIEINPRRFSTAAGKGETSSGSFDLQSLVDRGLRAQLQIHSFITGQLFIQLDYYPNETPKYVGAITSYPEIPTVPSLLDKLGGKLENYSYEKLLDNLAATMSGLERLVNSPELMDTIHSLNKVLQNVDTLVGNLDGQIAPISSNLNKTLVDAQKALADIRAVTGNLDNHAETMSASFEQSMAQANEAFSSLGEQLSDDSELHYQLSRALQELTESARSLRILSDTIERNPETLLKGKK